jgi:hypothetical protein
MPVSRRTVVAFDPPSYLRPAPRDQFNGGWARRFAERGRLMASAVPGCAHGDAVPASQHVGFESARACVDAWAALEFQVVYQGGPERPMRPSRRLATVGLT